MTQRTEIDLLGSLSNRLRAIYNSAEFQNDAGFLYSNISVKSYMDLRVVLKDRQTLPEIDIEQNQASIEFYVSDYRILHTRKYLKFQDFFINFLVKVIVLIHFFRFFYDPYQYNEYLAFALGKIFRLEINYDEEIKQNQLELLNINNEIQSNNNVVRLSPNLNNPQNKDTEEQKPNNPPEQEVENVNTDSNLGPENKNLNVLTEMHKKQRDEVKVECCDIAGAYPFCINKNGNMSKNEKWLKFELIRNAEEILANNMNALEVQKKLRRVELIEKMLLNHEQTIMMQNQARKQIINSAAGALTEKRNFSLEKEDKKRKFLGEYLKSKELGKIDLFLHGNLDAEYKTRIEN